MRGAHEEEFEAAYREGWMPTLAKEDDARLLYFMHLAHGSGRAYVVTTITAVRDGAAWERLARRIQTGDLRAWSRETDQLRHTMKAKMLFPLAWSDGSTGASTPASGLGGGGQAPSARFTCDASRLRSALIRAICIGVYPSSSSVTSDSGGSAPDCT